MDDQRQHQIAVIGAGPAGLMAAEILSAAGMAVTVYDRMPSPGRKLLMAGRGGLNLTHSEAFETFATRYGAASERLRPILEAFSPAALVAWAEGLGEQTFTGSSGRIDAGGAVAVLVVPTDEELVIARDTRALVG